MEAVSNWLKENGLGLYSAKFEEDGWDDITLLPEMTDTHIEACIQKPGHIMKFKRALRNLKPEISATINSDRTDGQESAADRTDGQESADVSVLYERTAGVQRSLTETQGQSSTACLSSALTETAIRETTDLDQDKCTSERLVSLQQQLENEISRSNVCGEVSENHREDGHVQNEEASSGTQFEKEDDRITLTGLEVAQKEYL